MDEPIDTDAMIEAWLHNDPVDVPLICRAVDRLQAGNAALERMLNAALVDVVNMANQETAGAVANEQALDDLRAENDALAAALGDIADGECMSYDAVCCWELDPADPEEWCSACVAEVAWSAWKMGVLGG